VRGEATLREAGFSRLAIANPVTAPYGSAAVAVMRTLGVHDVLAPRIVQGNNIAQTYQFVATGNAESGLVAYSQVKAWQEAPGSLWEVPAELHAPIEQAAVLLKKGQSNPAARAFVQFLQSEPARQVIQSYGYGLE